MHRTEENRWTEPYPNRKSLLKNFKPNLCQELNQSSPEIGLYTHFIKFNFSNRIGSDENDVRNGYFFFISKFMNRFGCRYGNSLSMKTTSIQCFLLVVVVVAGEYIRQVRSSIVSFYIDYLSAHTINSNIEFQTFHENLNSEWAILCSLRLADILVRPTQRLTKYGLLLGAIRKHVVDENDAESLDLMVCILLLNIMHCIMMCI